MQFLETKYLYFLLLAFTILYPLAQSFEKRLQLYKKWKSILFGITGVIVVFVPWDVYFTKNSVWWFNESYTTGVKLFNLPIEEVLFFVFVPYACIFIYEVLNYFIKRDVLGGISKIISFILGAGFMVIALIFNDQIYTFITFLLTGLALLVAGVVKPKWLGRFYLAYFVSLIPFLLINGILTGSLIESPVVNYDETQIIGFRLITIPVEDAIYNLLMLLIVFSIYERVNSGGQTRS